MQNDPRFGWTKTLTTDANVGRIGTNGELSDQFEGADSWESVRSKRPELLPDMEKVRYQNAPAHGALRFRVFLAKQSTTKVDHPHYPRDVAPCHFRLFPKKKLWTEPVNELYRPPHVGEVSTNCCV
jgi:hypothetical protein